jgi:hypothetical protein
MINEKHFNGLMMDLPSLHKTIVARKLENKAVDISNNNKMSDVTISKFRKVIEV